jgi:Dynamin GTPase effector domain
LLQTLRVPTGTTEQEEVQVEVTRVLVESYFDLVRKNLQDAVPKAVMHFLVRPSVASRFACVRPGWFPSILPACCVCGPVPRLASLLPGLAGGFHLARLPCVRPRATSCSASARPGWCPSYFACLLYV